MDYIDVDIKSYYTSYYIHIFFSQNLEFDAIWFDIPLVHDATPNMGPRDPKMNRSTTLPQAFGAPGFGKKTVQSSRSNQSRQHNMDLKDEQNMTKLAVFLIFWRPKMALSDFAVVGHGAFQPHFENRWWFPICLGSSEAKSRWGRGSWTNSSS